MTGLSSANRAKARLSKATTITPANSTGATTVATPVEAEPAHHARHLASEIERLRPLIVAAGQFAD